MTENWRCDHGKQADDYCQECIDREKNPHAVALGKIKSPRKAESSRQNGKLGGRPKKTEYVLCPKCDYVHGIDCPEHRDKS